MEDFSQYNQDFNNEFTCGTDWIDLHLNTLFLELQDIYTATYIFRVVDSEWDKRVQEKEVPGVKQPIKLNKFIRVTAKSKVL